MFARTIFFSQIGGGGGNWPPAHASYTYECRLCLHFPVTESEPTLPNARPVLLSAVKDHIICVFPD